MGKDGFSPKLESMVKTLLPYTDMKLGQIIKIWAIDALTGNENCLQVQVAGMAVDTRLGDLPIFQFLKSDFALFGHDRKTPFVPVAGTLAGAGITAQHLPTTDLCAFGLGIGLGRDYSFRNVNGSHECAYVVMINRYEVYSPPADWRPDLKGLVNHVVKIDAIKVRLKGKGRRRAKGLLRQLIVRTGKVTYRLSAVGSSGIRTLSQVGYSWVCFGELIVAEVGRPMLFKITGGGAYLDGTTLETMIVESISPDPDKE